MCRWIAYSGAPLRLEELILKPEYSLIEQSYSCREGVELTNGDGFGLGNFHSRGPVDTFARPSQPGMIATSPRWPGHCSPGCSLLMSERPPVPRSSRQIAILSAMVNGCLLTTG